LYIIKKKKNEVFFFRITKRKETLIKNPMKFGLYWHVVERIDKLKNEIEKSMFDIYEHIPYIIICKGKYSELGLENRISDNGNDLAYNPKYLFNRRYHPSVKILYKGNCEKILNFL
jgi:hypothetical protein